MVIYFKNYLLNHIRTDNTLFGVCGLEKKCLSAVAVRICCLQGGIYIIGPPIYYMVHDLEYIEQVPKIFISNFEPGPIIK